jgi:creatinine amidohydrolase/Fe(II)-dependent formamide hydrolase-like protein
MTRSALLFLLALALCPAASAQAPKSLFLEELTWNEVRDQAKGGKSIILVPIGGTEQNGPHMVLGKHSVRARFLAGKIAAALGTALVAPVMSYVPEGSIDPPTGHMRFPGTITVPEDAFEKVLESAARGFRLHGFRHVVFLGDHGGYQKSLKHVADRLNREWAKDRVRVHALDEYYRASDAGFATALKARGFKDEEIGTHAGLADTSLALAIDPALVRSEKLGSPSMGAADGVYGKPNRATAELGKIGVDLIVERSVKSIRESTARR